MVGTDRKISLFEVAERAKEYVKAGRDGADLDTKEKADTPLTFPNGVHIAEIEIDPDTGKLDLVRYTAVDDCGVVLNPMIVEGQVHGGMAQGLGQALIEHAVYDAAAGSSSPARSWITRCPARAPHAARAARGLPIVPATTNPLGVKGVGEAGTTAAIAAVMNAVADAVPNGAADHMEMPATRVEDLGGVPEGGRG